MSDLHERMVEALRHMKVCAVCAEDWNDCEAGREALAILAEHDAAAPVSKSQAKRFAALEADARNSAKAAYFETHEPPHCPTCDCGAKEDAQVRRHEAVGEAGCMPGTEGFTMACFRATDVPVGTKLYTAPASQPDSKVKQADSLVNDIGGENTRDATKTVDAIIRDVCELDPDDPKHPQTICILRGTLMMVLDHHLGVDRFAAIDTAVKSAEG